MQLPNATSKTEWIERVRRAEQLGYDVVAFPDHISSQLAPLPALVVAGEATERIRLGTFVLDNDFRHPLVMAQEAATVDLLTGGRLELGIGAGWHGLDYERLGIEFATPKVRYERLTEAVAILESYFRGESFSFDGTHFKVTDVEPTPTSSETPKLLIGGGGPRILHFAARHADIVSVFLTSLPDGSGFDISELSAETYRVKTDRVRAVAGDRNPELNVLLQHFEITNDRAAVAESRAEDWNGTGDDLLALPFELMGTLDQIVDDLLERRERYGISYVTVFDRYLDEFGPVIERLSGA